MSEIRLPEAITRAIQEYGNAVCLRDDVTVALDNLRRAIAAELLMAEAQGIEIGASHPEPYGMTDTLRAQAAALEAGGGETR